MSNARFRNSHVQERLQLAVEELATSNRKLKERVIDVYQDHLFPLRAAEFPDEETRRIFAAIREIVAKEENKRVQRPGPYKIHLREGLKTPIDIVRSTLDYRTAGRLAKLMLNLYFAIQFGIMEEYERELDSRR